MFSNGVRSIPSNAASQRSTQNMVYLTTATTALLAAAALISLVDFVRATGETSPQDEVATTDFWYANMNHSGPPRGYAPDLGGDDTYEVFKTVEPGDGAAIQEAIDDDRGKDRRPQWWASQPRVVYLSGGIYEVSTEIKMRVGTILIGDPTDPPIIKANRNWQGGRRLINGLDPHTADVHRGTTPHGELSFTVGLKNIVVDTTNIDERTNSSAIYWRVAQGAQMQDVKVVMPASGTDGGHTGILVGQGSSLGLSDVRIEGGWNGIWHEAHQQMAYKNIHFFKNERGMRISGGNVITITSSIFDTVGTAVVHEGGGTPWIAIIDCKSINSGLTFITSQWPSLLIDNFERDDDDNVVDWHNDPIIADTRHIDQFTYANTFGRKPIYGKSMNTSSNRPGALVKDGKYPSIVAPNYGNKTTDDFINVKDPAYTGGKTVLGDHIVDEAPILNEILRDAAREGKIVYFPFGKYRVESTLFIPPGSQIIGEAWPTIVGSGTFFADENDPKPVVQIGNEDDVGIAHIQDMRVTVADRLPGAILVQVNMAGEAPGDVAIWNSLITVGGTAGSDGIDTGCHDYSKECKAAFLGLHLSKSSSAYIENTWVWVADHHSEAGGGCAIAAKGGVLVQATKGTWLHALGVEHWWLYQLNLWQAQNVFISMLQAETNYDQGSNARQVPPAPWKPDAKRWNDPDFLWCRSDDKICRKGYANFITGGSAIRHYASAAWEFFSGPRYKPCEDPWRCTNVMHWISEQPSDTQLFGLCSKSAANVLREADGHFIPARPDFRGGWPGEGSNLAVFRFD